MSTHAPTSTGRNVLSSADARPSLLPAESYRRELEVMAAALASLAGVSVEEVAVPPRVDSADQPIDGRAAYVLDSDVVRYHRWDSERGEWSWLETANTDELTYWIVDDLASAAAWIWAQRQASAAGMRDQQAVEQLWRPRWQSLLSTVIPTRPAAARSATSVEKKRHSPVVDSKEAEPAVAPAPAAPSPPPKRPADSAPEEKRTSDTPWGVGANSGPPPSTFMSDRGAWYTSKPVRIVLLVLVVLAVAASVAFVLLRGGENAPAPEQAPSVTPTPASSQQMATSSPSAQSGTPSASAPPAAPPPPVGEAQQITPPRPASTYYPTWYPDYDSDDGPTRERPPPPAPLYTPPVFR